MLAHRPPRFGERRSSTRAGLVFRSLSHAALRLRALPCCSSGTARRGSPSAQARRTPAPKYCGRCIRADDPPHLPLEKPGRCRRSGVAGTTAVRCRARASRQPLFDRARARFDGLMVVAARRSRRGRCRRAGAVAPPAREHCSSARPASACRTAAGELRGGRERSREPRSGESGSPRRARITPCRRARHPTRARRGRGGRMRASGQRAPARGG